MTLLKRDTQLIAFCRPMSGVQEQTDEDGNYTGEREVQYDIPIFVDAIVSEPTGRIVNEMFGEDERYDRVVIMKNSDADGAVQPQTVFFINNLPRPGVFNQKFDHIVRRIAKSHNFTAIALERVAVT